MNTIDIEAMSFRAIKTELVKCTVCGINIKPIPCVNESRKGELGLFLHIRVPNGDQYDYIWKLYNHLLVSDYNYDDPKMTGVVVDQTFTNLPVKHIQTIEDERYNLIGIPRKKDVKKTLKKGLKKHYVLSGITNTTPVIPNLFKLLGANEWVEVIGAEVMLPVLRVAGPDEPLIIDPTVYGCNYPDLSIFPARELGPDEPELHMTPAYIDIHTSDRALAAIIGHCPMESYPWSRNRTWSIVNTVNEGEDEEEE